MGSSPYEKAQCAAHIQLWVAINAYLGIANETNDGLQLPNQLEVSLECLIAFDTFGGQRPHCRNKGCLQLHHEVWFV
jgi:hypothetical protein